jgi:hypothetical protein
MNIPLQYGKKSKFMFVEGLIYVSMLEHNLMYGTALQRVIYNQHYIAQRYIKIQYLNILLEVIIIELNTRNIYIYIYI